MTNHTDQDAREAREWAEYITSVRELHGTYAPQARAAARFILDNTTPAAEILHRPHDNCNDAAADQIEYGVEYTGRNTGHRFTGSNASWHAKRKYAEMEHRQMAKSGMKPRLVARRVSAPWEVTDE